MTHSGEVDGDEGRVAEFDAVLLAGIAAEPARGNRAEAVRVAIKDELGGDQCVA
jgi:hypothetical protein